MRFAPCALAVAVGLLAAAPFVARADGPCTPQPPAPQASTQRVNAPAPAPEVEESPIARARDLLAHAKILDDAATSDERVAAELERKLGVMREGARLARIQVDRAKPVDRDAALARAETLEADLVVSEIEIASRRRAASDNRKSALDLRERAVRAAKGEPQREAPRTPPLYLPTQAECTPPFVYAPDGRKIYKLECL
jgi:hypothetical protein